MDEIEDQLLKETKYLSTFIPKDFSDEEMARDWSLSDLDKKTINSHWKESRTFVAAQICSIRLYGRFIGDVATLSPRIINYLNNQLDLPPSLSIIPPDRKATYIEQRKTILDYLGFRKYDANSQEGLKIWLTEQIYQGGLPDDLLKRSESYLLSKRIMLPGESVLKRLIVSIASEAHENIFDSLYLELSPDLKQSIDQLLTVAEGEQRSYFYKLKEYPPSARISSLKNYLNRYQVLEQTGIDSFEGELIDPSFQHYLFKLTKNYSSKYLNRFKEHKRYAMMVCFLIETRKTLLDHLVKMHDQYISDTCRQSKRIHEKKHRDCRKKQKKAVDIVLDAGETIIDSKNEFMTMKMVWEKFGKEKLAESMGDLRMFKYLEERGYGDILLARYPSLRKYFPDFLLLPFATESGSDDLMKSIEIARGLNSGDIKSLPMDAPTSFMPKDLYCVFRNPSGKVNRNAWEMGLALAMKDRLRSGDLYLPQSKQHVSFWNLILNDINWEKSRKDSFEELRQPKKCEVKNHLIKQFRSSTDLAKKRFDHDKFAEIINGKLRLKRDDKALIPPSVTNLQNAIDISMPTIRIEQLLMEVDQLTGFSRHFVPIQRHQSRPKNFYKTLIAAIISQATNLGVVSMSASIKDISVHMLRRVLDQFVREETLMAANAEIVNYHHQLPFSSIHGKGTLSSSDAQRFKIRADSLLASYYPRYYGYYEKAIGIYTHVSDQYSVFSTKAISCSPREALYVLDGLLENNTILKIREHTTDTHGYTEIIFALCYLLGFYFMPRIRDLKDQQLYRVEKGVDYGAFSPLLNKSVDMSLIEEQWEPMIRVALSLKRRTAPAHVIVQRLTSSFPSDRLSKAFTNLGRIIKTEYILRYLTDPELRRTIQIQLNKGEYRHKLPRWVFFANQGEFCTGDYEEIMNKASCLSLVSNAILCWNTIKIDGIVEGLRNQEELVDNDALGHISLLPFKHVLPNGTYFIDEQWG